MSDPTPLPPESAETYNGPLLVTLTIQGRAIKSVLAERFDTESGQLQYLVKWQDPKKENAWVPEAKFTLPALTIWKRQQGRNDLNSSPPRQHKKKRIEKDLEAKKQSGPQDQGQRPARSSNFTSSSSALNDHLTHAATHNNSNTQASNNQHHLCSNDAHSNDIRNNDARSNYIRSNDIRNNDAHNNDTRSNDACKNDARKNDIRSNDIRNNDAHNNDTRSNDACENDARKNDIRSNDTRSNDTRSNGTRSNDTRSNDRGAASRPAIQSSHSHAFTPSTAAQINGSSQRTHTPANPVQSGGASTGNLKSTSKASNVKKTGSNTDVDWDWYGESPKKSRGFITNTEAFARSKMRSTYESTYRPTPRPIVPKGPYPETFNVPPKSIRRKMQAQASEKGREAPAPEPAKQSKAAQNREAIKFTRTVEKSPPMHEMPLQTPGTGFSSRVFLAGVFGEVAQESHYRQIDTEPTELTCYYWLCHMLGVRDKTCRHSFDTCRYAHRFTGVVRDLYHYPPRRIKAESIEDLDPKQFMCPYTDRGRCHDQTCMFAHGHDLMK